MDDREDSQSVKAQLFFFLTQRSAEGHMQRQGRVKLAGDHADLAAQDWVL